MLRGLGVSSGIVYGRALVLDPAKFVLSRKSISKGKGVTMEIARFRSALKNAAQDLQALKSDVRRSVGADHAGIFEAHILLLRDPAIIELVTKTIKEQLVVAEWAVQEVFQETISALSIVGDHYLRERISDLEDVRDRVLDAQSRDLQRNPLLLESA